MCVMNIKAETAIKEYQLLCPGDRVVAAVSGGADSVALFGFLRAWCPRHDVVLYAAHVNHGLRPAADAEEAFVRQLCERAGVPLFVCRAELGQKGAVSEEDARAARYAFFDRLAQDYHAKVATAHTASDNAETLLFRLARGSSVAGAAGIPVRRGYLIRPLLFCTRAQTEQFCAAHGMEFVTDESNLTDRYARNRIRRSVLPALATVNSAAEQNLALFAKDCGELSEYLNGQAKQLLNGQENEVSARLLLAAPAPVRRAALALLAAPYAKVDRGLLARCEAALAGEVQKTELTRGVYAAVRKEKLVFWRDLPPQTDALPLQEGVCRAFGAYLFEVSVCDVAEMIKICKQSKKELKNFADYDMIFNNPVFSPQLRTPRPGDRFAPAGRGVTKRLTRLLAEEGVTQQQRGLLPLLASGQTVLWLYGRGVARCVQPSAESRRVVYLRPIQEKN